jgi:hypothetical protein
MTLANDLKKPAAKILKQTGLFKSSCIYSLKALNPFDFYFSASFLSF